MLIEAKATKSTVLWGLFLGGEGGVGVLVKLA